MADPPVGGYVSRLPERRVDTSPHTTRATQPALVARVSQHDAHEPAAWKLDEQGWLEVEQDEAGVLLDIHLSPGEVQRLYIDLTRALGALGSPGGAAAGVEVEDFDPGFAAVQRLAAESDVLRAEVERWRAAWALWRPGIENTRDFYEKDGNEPRARAYAAILRDFDACTC